MYKLPKFKYTVNTLDAISPKYLYSVNIPLEIPDLIHYNREVRPHSGEMSEWSKVTDSKSVEPKGS